MGPEKVHIQADVLVFLVLQPREEPEGFKMKYTLIIHLSISPNTAQFQLCDTLEFWSSNIQHSYQSSQHIKSHRICEKNAPKPSMDAWNHRDIHRYFHLYITLWGEILPGKRLPILKVTIITMYHNTIFSNMVTLSKCHSGVWPFKLKGLLSSFSFSYLSC